MSLQQSEAGMFCEKRLRALRETGFPHTTEELLDYLVLVGDFFRLLRCNKFSGLGGGEFELELVFDFFKVVTPAMIDSALHQVCGRSSAELAEQADVSDVKALEAFVLDRDRLTSIKIVLDQLYGHRRWSARMLQSRERFEHSLKAYDAWLENQFVRHAVCVRDLAALLGERSILRSSPRSV